MIKEGQGQRGCSRVSEGKRIGEGWQGCADHWKDFGFDSECVGAFRQGWVSLNMIDTRTL